ALIAGCVVAAFATIVGWRMHAVSPEPGAVTASAPGDPAASTPSQAETAAPEARIAGAERAVILPAQPASSGDEARGIANAAITPQSLADATTRGAETAAGSDTVPVEIKSLPARAAPARTPRRSAPEKAVPSTAPATPTPPPEPVAAP